MTSCYPKVEKDLNKTINTATSDEIFTNYLDLGEAIHDENSELVLAKKNHLIYLAQQFPNEELINQIEGILSTKKSQQEQYLLLTFQIQKILKNSQGLHYPTQVNEGSIHQRIWISSDGRNLENPYH